jgi:hypothetical protein
MQLILNLGKVKARNYQTILFDNQQVRFLVITVIPDILAIAKRTN